MENSESNKQFVMQAVEASIKIAAIFIMASWCYQILNPFIAPLVWAGIIAVAIKPICDWLQPKLGGSRKRAAFVVTIIMLATLITPVVMLSSSMLENAQVVQAEIESGEYHVEPPSDKVKEWPMVGEKAHSVWSEAANNLEETLQKYRPQIKEFLGTVVKQAASFGGSILLFVLSIIISGFILASAPTGADFVQKFAKRLAGDAGVRFVSLASVTVRNVTRGILGVAIIQAVLAALGFYIMDIPGAPILALGVLILGIVQVSPGLILIPVSIYVFSVASPVVASLFLVWNIIVGALDNVLKPLLMGQGSDVPTLVIFLGAIGGFIMMGLVGLFVGAVIVVLGYELFLAWLNAGEEESVEAIETDQ